MGLPLRFLTGVNFSRQVFQPVRIIETFARTFSREFSAHVSKIASDFDGLFYSEMKVSFGLAVDSTKDQNLAARRKILDISFF